MPDSPQPETEKWPPEIWCGNPPHTPPHTPPTSIRATRRDVKVALEDQEEEEEEDLYDKENEEEESEGRSLLLFTVYHNKTKDTSGTDYGLECKTWVNLFDWAKRLEETIENMLKKYPPEDQIVGKFSPKGFFCSLLKDFSGLDIQLSFEIQKYWTELIFWHYVELSRVLQSDRGDEARQWIFKFEQILNGIHKILRKTISEADS